MNPLKLTEPNQPYLQIPKLTQEPETDRFGVLLGGEVIRGSSLVGRTTTL